MQVTTEKLMQDLRTVVTDAEELLKATAGQSGERIEKVRGRAEQSLRIARERMQAAGQSVQDNVTENPWTAVGIAAGVGLIAGILLSRR
jgi:ElaB/YqjD/DUF883 family membrane-anchored ribosome-binding protein